MRQRISDWIEIAVACLFVTILFVAPLSFGAVRAQEFVYIQWLVVGVLVLWMLQIWITPRIRLLFPPTCWAVLPALAYAVWRYRAADVEYAARVELVQLLVVAFLFLAFVANVYSQEKILWITAALIFVATFAAMYGTYQWLTGSNRVWFAVREAYAGRASGPFISPNHLAGFLEMSFPLAVALLIVSRLGALRRVLLAYAAGVILIGIAASGSRAGWISTGTSVLLLGLALLKTRRQWWSALIVVSVVTGLGLGLYNRVIVPRLAAPEGAQGKFDDIRFSIWKSAWRMWDDNKIIGVGPNHFDIRYPRYRENHWAAKMRPGYVHNDYLNTLVDWGAIGFVLFLIPIGLAGMGIKRLWPFLQRGGNEFKKGGSNRAGFVLGASVGLAAILVHSFFDFNLHIPANTLVAATILAIMTAHWRFATERYWLSVNWFSKLFMTVLLGAATWYLSMNALLKSRESTILTQADRAVPASTNEVALLKKAFQIEPQNFETAFRIGDRLRILSFAGGEDAERLAREAMEWFRRAIALNPWHVASYAGLGMCLDWTMRYQEAEVAFQKAIGLDPNHFQTRALMGWHLFQMEKYRESIKWFDRSVELNSNPENTIAFLYRDLALKEIAKANKLEH